MKLKDKLERLKRIIAETDGLVVAFSGGVDSTLLAHVAHEVLGERALAVTAQSETFPAWELEEAKALAARIGIRHRFIRTSELRVPQFRANPPDRCYHCKKALFRELLAVAREEGLAKVADGTNLDDRGDYRPGLKALEELGVISPLREAGLGKSDIRRLCRRLGLPNWKKPAFACLASRFPYGETITEEKLRRVARAEDLLRSLGFELFRVRYHGHLARIEVPPGRIRLAVRHRREIVEAFKSLGFLYVALDLEGYRTGSMNEPLKPPS